MGEFDGLLQRANAALELGRSDEAKTWASQAIAQSPDNPRGHIALAWATIKDSPADSLAAAQRAIALNPDSPRAFDVAAQAALANSDKPQALNYVKRYRDLEPNSSRSHRQYAEVLLRLGKPKEHRDEALASANEAIRLHPNSADAWTTLGRVQSFAFGKDKEAKKSFEEALRLDPNDGFAKRQLAHTTEESGDKASALALVQSVIRLDPTDRSARRQLDDLVLGFMSDLLWLAMLLSVIAAIVVESALGT